jgi:hypothetical protein
MSLTLTAISVGIVAAVATLTIHQSKINRVRSDKARMMMETEKLVQKFAKDAEEAILSKTIKEEADLALAEVQRRVEEVSRRSAESKAFSILQLMESTSSEPTPYINPSWVPETKYCPSTRRPRKILVDIPLD